MFHTKFCVFAVLAVILAVSLGDASSVTELDAALDEELFAAELKVQTLDFAEWRRKVSNCVNQVDKNRLKREEIEILLRCVAMAVSRPPFIPQAIAIRYVQCVVGGSASGPLRVAAMQVAQCVRNS